MNIARPQNTNDAMERVLELQRKLHHWALDDRATVFVDLANLVRDPAVLFLAVRQAMRARGATTAGVDGVTKNDVDPWWLFRKAQQLLRANHYSPNHLRAVKMVGKNGKERVLGIPTLIDRVIQSALRIVLEPIFEADFLDSSHAYRSRRSIHTAVESVRDAMNSNPSFTHVVEGDITACFDSIPHTKLRAAVRRRIGDRKILKWLEHTLHAGAVTDGQPTRRVSGTPQGGSISPFLSNIFLHWLDEAVESLKSEGITLHYARYADDFVVLVENASVAEDVKSYIAEVLQALGLELSSKKTSITSLAEGFYFLGYQIKREKNETCSVRIAERKVSEWMKTVVQKTTTKRRPELRLLHLVEAARAFRAAHQAADPEALEDLLKWTRQQATSLFQEVEKELVTQ